MLYIVVVIISGIIGGILTNKFYSIGLKEIKKEYQFTKK